MGRGGATPASGCSLGSNLLWGLWGWHDGAYALIALQVALAVLNIRGVSKTETAAK